MIGQNKYKNQKAFVLLFAVVLSAVIFAIALGMTDIALKQVNFTTSAKNTNEAFFAADSGAECALFHDLNGAQSLFGQVPGFGSATSTVQTYCAGMAVDLNNGDPYEPQTNPPNGWTFILHSLGTGGQSCAIVNLKKTLGANQAINTTIISKGYNVGDQNCVSSDVNRVERVLELRY